MSGRTLDWMRLSRGGRRTTEDVKRRLELQSWLHCKQMWCEATPEPSKVLPESIAKVNSPCEASVSKRQTRGMGHLQSKLPPPAVWRGGLGVHPRVG